MKAKHIKEFMGDDIGVSSRTMLCCFIGVKNDSTFGNDIPHDPADFGRCYRLLKRNPEFKQSISQLRKFKKWIPFVDNWYQLTALYEEELNNEDGRAPKLYKLIQELITPKETP